MVTSRCKMAVKTELKKLGLTLVSVDLGEVEIVEQLSVQQRFRLGRGLFDSGLEIMDNKKAILIEKIGTVITQMIHNTDILLKVNYSDYISQELGYDYTYLSNVFSGARGITIQQFIIAHKIERAKEYLMYGEINLTEISYKLHYSSVAHLSNQFKK